MDVRGFDSITILKLRGEIPRPIEDLPYKLRYTVLGRHSTSNTGLCFGKGARAGDGLDRVGSFSPVSGGTACLTLFLQHMVSSNVAKHVANQDDPGRNKRHIKHMRPYLTSSFRQVMPTDIRQTQH